MASLGNRLPGNRSGAYFFEEDSDEPGSSDRTPLVRRPPSHSPPTPHTHIITGYLTFVEAIVLVAYVGSLVGLTLWHHEYKLGATSDSLPDKMVAYFCMIHVAVWVMVGLFDRVVQWRHQVLRRKGYLKFYRKMRNVRRVPFIIVSLSNAAQLLYVSILYYFHIGQKDNYHGLFPVDVLYIIVGLEALITLPCLAYYIVRAVSFNYARLPPDVIQETYSGPESPTTSVTAVGFRDGEDLDELLERQADMIRYLQQHNANLGRRILELQAQSVE